MARTSKERKRAARLRKARDAGTISTDDLRWLEDYEGPLTAEARPAALDLSPIAEDPGEHVAPYDVADLGSPGTDLGSIVPDEDRPNGEAKEAPTIAGLAPVKVCTIPDCPACGKAQRGIECPVTGEVVWPPISTHSAALVGGIIVSILSYARTRRGKGPITPDQKMMGELASAIRESAYRRAPSLGAHDDYLTILAILYLLWSAP